MENNFSSNTYFLQLTTVDNLAVFSRIPYRQIVINTLRFFQNKCALIMHAYVILPDSLYLVVSVPDTAYQMGAHLRDFKKYSANQIFVLAQDDERQHLRTVMRINGRRTSRVFAVWQSDTGIKTLFSKRIIKQKIDLLHYLPVTQSIVSRPIHYLYSSARDYVKGGGRNTFLEIKNILDDM